MTTSRNFEAEYIAACTANRIPGATLAERFAAEDLMNAIIEAACDAEDAGDATATAFLNRSLEIDEAVRVSLYGATA